MKFFCYVVDKLLHIWCWWHCIIQEWKESSRLTEEEEQEVIINHFDDQWLDEHLFI